MVMVWTGYWRLSIGLFYRCLVAFKFAPTSNTNFLSFPSSTLSITILSAHLPSRCGAWEDQYRARNYLLFPSNTLRALPKATYKHTYLSLLASVDDSTDRASLALRGLSAHGIAFDVSCSKDFCNRNHHVRNNIAIVRMIKFGSATVRLSSNQQNIYVPGHVVQRRREAGCDGGGRRRAHGNNLLST